MNKILVWLLAFTILILLTIGGYLIFQNQKLIKQLANQEASLSPISSPQISPTLPESPTPSPTTKMTLAQVQENIEAAMNTGNTQAIGTFATNPVLVILQATECCGQQTPDKAVSQLSYVSEGAPFNFDQNSDLIKSLKSKNPELAGKFIGVSQNKEQLIAFGLNSENRISDIRMSVSYKLLSY